MSLAANRPRPRLSGFAGTGGDALTDGGRLPPARPAPRFDTSLTMVNIVLLLVFFFLPTSQNQILSHIETARSTLLRPQNIPAPVLEIGQDGKWRLDGRVVSPALLDAALGPQGRGKPIHLILGPDAPALTLVQTLAHPALAGADLRLVTRHRGGGAQGG
ncbi:ExbD/TolR family protein [Paracoccus jiaweipingae]|uniref:ExbD/TolR family protein n=1 Tax=unclassified Paracoccus (in: a-proteobacteria) TaxID=2688777 RepID=UPI0037975A49